MPYYRGSWYSQLPPFGWNDFQDKPGSAALQDDQGKSVPDWQQGIALPTRNTLGKWFNVTPPGGGIPYPAQQTDIGPANWTGRGTDISANLAHQMGYTPQTFPTDAQFKIEPRDEPRGLGSPAGPVYDASQGTWGIVQPDRDVPSAPEGDVVARGGGRRMPEDNSLFSMFRPQGGYYGAGGQQDPNLDFGGALAQRQNSLIGLGLGLMNQRPSTNSALAGFAHGANTDAEIAARNMSLQERRAERALAQRNADRSFAEQVRQFNLGAEGGKIPPGFQRDASGNLAPIPGGPADPKYLQASSEARFKPRELSVTDITKLSDEGKKFGQVAGFTDTFEPRFAGYKSSTVGELANLAGRNVPGLVSKDVAEGAAWWQGYDSYKNVTRHELYGGALTPPEIAVFEKANISPGMDPEQIKKNLEVQKSLFQKGMRTKANAMIAAGYDPVTIGQAYGVDLKELGVTQTGRRGGPGPGTVSGGGALDEARQAIKNGAPRDAVIKRLRENNIDPSGL